MLELTFGEQVKIVLNRKGMTIKQLAEMIEERTGKKMSRQNLTQRLSRDNFQEQDMRLIASILECPFYLSIMEENADSEYTTSQDKKRKDINTDIMDAEAEQLTLNLEFEEPEPKQEEQPEKVADTSGSERDITVGELVDINKELDQMEQSDETIYEEEPEHEAAVYEEEPEHEAAVYEEEPVYDGENGYRAEPEYESAEYTTEEVGYAEESEYENQSGYEEDSQYIEEAESEEPEDVNQILEEVAAMEAEEKKEREEKEREKREKEQEKEQEKPRGWRAYFPRRKKKQSESVHEDKHDVGTEQPDYAVNQEQEKEPVGEDMTEKSYQNPEEYQEPEEYQDSEQYQEPEEYQDSEEYQGADREYEEYVQENEQEMEDEFADTAQDWETSADENVGEINPYTGLEYESNSVRMHPKRIGYVQVYDRSDHQWTDMTEWAFLGYQERKKALLGKDYEPPIYLD